MVELTSSLGPALFNASGLFTAVIDFRTQQEQLILQQANRRMQHIIVSHMSPVKIRSKIASKPVLMMGKDMAEG
jgi:hypothetical protein